MISIGVAEKGSWRDNRFPFNACVTAIDRKKIRMFAKSLISLVFIQIPYHEGHISPVPRNPTGARGGPHQDGGESGPQEQLQTLVVGPKD